ncbi:winged helix DNA-binding domain-containing protein [Streptomyces sp. 6N223]|uniref:winged helix DNA-binding domain-containing protein n=1 Tax=Streptomyces sp. 6N223 TaxID=3457412 RepID=UPI003FD41BB7
MSSTPTTPALSLRELNRALLDRQLLLARSPMDAAQAVEHLVGLQTQVPGNHYTALFARLDGFDAAEFSRRFAERELVRMALLRSTIHTVTARDCLALRPLLQPPQERMLKSAYGKRLAGVDLERLARRARELAEEEPRTFHQFGQALAGEWPDSDPQALGMAVRVVLPMVQTPPRGLWQRGGATRHTTAESWLRGEPAEAATLDDLVLRYLAAFGPASVRDAQIWSGLTRLREVFDRLAPRLVRLRDAGGTELFDLPDAPRPGADVPAPARFLPEFDNVFIGHDDRTRVISDAAKRRSWLGNRAIPVFLADGFVRGSWRIDADRRHTEATLVLTPFDRPSRAERASLEDEGARLLAFHTPGASHDLRWEEETA